MTTNSQKTRDLTPEENFRELYKRFAQLNDKVSALLAPAWGSEMGIIPSGHPLYQGEASSGPAATEATDHVVVHGGIFAKGPCGKDTPHAPHRGFAGGPVCPGAPDPASAPLRDQIAAALETAWQDSYREGYGLPREEMADAVLTVRDREMERLTFIFDENTRRHQGTSSRVDELLATVERVRSLVAGTARTTSEGISDYDIGRHDMARAVLAALDEPPTPAATETEPEKTARVLAALHRSAEQDVSRVIALYERWVKAGPPPLGTSVSRWWDARLLELREAIRPPEEEPVMGAESLVNVTRLVDEDGEPLCTCTYGERCPNCRD